MSAAGTLIFLHHPLTPENNLLARNGEGGIVSYFTWNPASDNRKLGSARTYLLSCDWGMLLAENQRDVAIEKPQAES